jgi:hypothetical protein
VQSYTLRLTGPGVPGAHRLPGALVRDLFDALDRGARGAVRLRLEGRSASRGPVPGWLERAARFDLQLDADLPDGALRLTAPTLGESLRDRFAQTDLFADPISDETPVSLFTAGLADAVRGRRDSEAFDDALLPAFEELGRVFARHVASIEIRNGHPDAPPLTVTAEGIQVVEQLKLQIPRPQRVRVAGRLDAIRYSDRAFTLVLPDGPALRGVYPGDDGGQLKEHFGQVVAVSGTGHFKPSGALRVIEADGVTPATEGDLGVFATIPTSPDAPFDPRALRVPQRPNTGVNAIFGKWPGDETDEEILRMLGDLG